MIWTWGVLAFLLAMGADAPPPARPIASPSDLMSVDASLGRARRLVLPNGMTVILLPDPTTRVVGMELSYQVGTRDDPDQRPGLASTVNSLMMRGTKHVGPGEFSRLLQEAGGRWSWQTGIDRSSFSVTVPADAVALPLWLLSDQMGFLVDTLSDAAIAQQAAAVDANRVRRQDNVARGHVWQALEAAVYPAGHPYHHVSGRPEPGLPPLTVADVRAFVQRHYTPGRARLAISGAFDPARVSALVTQYFATLPAGAPGPRRTAERPVLAQEIRLHMAAHVDLPSVSMAWPTPAQFEPQDAALDAVAELLTGSRAGLLRFKLVDQLKIASEVTAGQHSRRLGSMFVISATAAPGHTTADLVAGIDAVLRDAKTHPATPYLFIGAVTGYVIERIFRLQVHEDLANLYAHCDEQGALQSCIYSWLSGYLTLTSRDLSEAIASQLPLDRRVVIQVDPSPDAPLAGQLLDVAP